MYLFEELNRQKKLMGLFESLYEVEQPIAANTEGEPEAPQEVDIDAEIASGKRQKFDDLFYFLATPRSKSQASVYYATSDTFDNNLAKPKTNPMMGRFFKYSRFMFKFDRSYAEEVAKVNPDWQIQAAKGNYKKVEGFSMLKELNGTLRFPIIPTGTETLGIFLMDEDKKTLLQTMDWNTLKEKFGQYFMPSTFTPKTSGSGVFQLRLKVDSIVLIKAGGKDFPNPHFQFPHIQTYLENIAK